MPRATIKPEKSTRDRLREHKRDDETWDDLLNRLAEYAELVQE